MSLITEFEDEDSTHTNNFSLHPREVSKDTTYLLGIPEKDN
jgi:hypothetical protein